MIVIIIILIIMRPMIDDRIILEGINNCIVYIF